ncbi:MAG: hypothetical protein JWQ54_4486 [Mucilaginibacter sp.]|nr:hypothetical protein [Mucilaginibacter sp.]
MRERIRAVCLIILGNSTENANKLFTLKTGKFIVKS